MSNPQKILPTESSQEKEQNIKLTVSLNPQSKEDEIDLRGYWAVFKKYKWHILSITFFVGLLAALYSFSLTPIYRATATLLLEVEAANIVAIEKVYDQQYANNEYYNAHAHMLQSYIIANQVIERLDLENHPDFDTTVERPGFLGFKLDGHDWLSALFPEKKPEKPSPSDQRYKLVETFQSRLEVTQVMNSPLLEIRFESSDPKLAANVANTLVETYIKNDLESRLQMTKKAAGWLIERLEGLRLNLEASEKLLQRYLEQNSLVDVEGVKSVVAAQFKEVSSELEKALKKLSEATNTYRQIQALTAKRVTNYESLPLVLNHPLVQHFKQIEAEALRKISELNKRYGSKHPTMIAAQAELNAAQNNTLKQVNQVIESFTNEYETARANVTALQKRMKQLEDEVQQITQKEYQLRVLQREVETNSQLYDMFLARFKETDVSQTQQSSVGRLVDPAVIPVSPAKPRKKLITALFLMVGFVLSVMLAFLLNYLDNTLKDSEDVEQKLGLPLLGVLPQVKVSKKDRFKLSHMFWREKKSQFTEAIRTIRTGIMLSKLDNPHKVLVVTSSVPSEGKTTFALNEAFALGQMNKTLLIDADMRRPSVGKAFGLMLKAPGLSELVAGTKKLSECIYTMEEVGVDLIPGGAILPPNPLELLASQHFKAILAKLEETYEYIVIDTAPIGLVSDALVLSSYANALIYIIKADSTPYQLAQDGIKRLQQVNAPILGVVLNQLDVKKSTKYYGKYGYYHKGYYG